VSIAGLPPELSDLLDRLRRRGLAVTPLEIGRLQHLLGIADDCDADRLPALLAAVLCKDAASRTLLHREYRAWVADYESADAEHGATPGSGRRGDARAGGGRADLGLLSEHAGTGPLGWRHRLRDLVATHARRLLVAAAALAAALALGALGWWWLAPPPPPPPAWSGPAGPPPKPPSGALCPQDLPTQAAHEVWAWVPVADNRPWVTLIGGLLLLALLALAVWRLRTSEGAAQRRWLPVREPDPGGDKAPRRGLPPLRIRGDLLLAPAARREMVWSIDRYVSEESDRALDPELTVAATARAAGEPRLVPRRRLFPRQVWLWCDRKSARSDTLEGLVLEVRRALEQANLPVRVARFYGLPARLTWEDSREPFAPGCHEAAGAEALVAVLTDGAALVQAWESPGERPRLAPLLRELRAWPRLLLVDLGDGELTRLAAEWRLPVRAGDGLTAWLAAARAETRADVDQARRPPPDPAQLDLWAGACLLGPGQPSPGEAQVLREKMGLRLGPFDDRHLAARLEACAADDQLAEVLVGRLARSQQVDRRGLPAGDGFFTRALAFWEARLSQGLDQLPKDEVAGRVRIQLAQAALQLWRDPEGAAKALSRIGGKRNRKAIRSLLERHGIGAGQGRGPTWDWQRLPVAVRWRLRALGLGGRRAGAYRLRWGIRHHLILASLAGIAFGGIGWGLERLGMPHEGGGVFADPRFRAQILMIPGAGRTWLGSPWRLTKLPDLGPLATPYIWEWQPARNPKRLGAHALLLTSGTRAFPIRACVPGWPQRSLAVIAADRGDAGALKLAIRLLDRSAADRVLIAPDWPERLADLTQGVRVPAQMQDGKRRPGDQLLVFLPPAAPIGRFDALGEVRGDFASLAKDLDFRDARPISVAWPNVSTRVLAGMPRVVGRPEIETDRFGITWVRVCRGTFLMGAPASEDRNLDHYAQGWVDAFGGTLDEKRKDVLGWITTQRPAHPVLVEGFEIARTELTAGQSAAAGGPGTGDPGKPIVNIRWAEARAVCRRAGGALPTEAQWEYAARAGTATPWSFGEDEGHMGDYAWFAGNSNIQAHPVGEKLPNGLCLADMHGNVYEWVQDCYDPDTYRARGRLTIDPARDKADCRSRVVRGGAFVDPPVGLRSAGRSVFVPGVRGGRLGLRCVRSRARQP
jgi:formylglycine-generating enzyme required for sulfatase activity